MLCEEQEVNLIENSPNLFIGDGSVNDGYLMDDDVPLRKRTTNKLSPETCAYQSKTSLLVYVEDRGTKYGFKSSLHIPNMSIANTRFHKPTITNTTLLNKMYARQPQDTRLKNTTRVLTPITSKQKDASTVMGTIIRLSYANVTNL